ncbi:hypothetical protein ES707_05822 [subsurface metagenome]
MHEAPPFSSASPQKRHSRVSAVFVTTQRDLRLDLFRGFANWAIFLGHIPNTALAWFTTRNYGFSDGADLFVFISGYTATLVRGRMMIERGFLIGATRLMRRVWQLYVAHLLIFLVYTVAVHYLAHNFDVPHLMDQFNVRWLMDRPVETLAQGLILRFKPLNLDVLPLYIVLMVSFPPILWLMLRYRNGVMIGSLLLYLTARLFDWNFSSYPEGLWYFNPLAWQLIFVFGGWLAVGGAGTVQFLIRSRVALAMSLFFLVFGLLMTLAQPIPALRDLFPAALYEFFTPNDKTNLAFYRILHLASLALVVVRFLPANARILSSPLLRPLIKCGQQSLEVFCVGVFLSFLAHVALEMTSDGLIAQLIVGATGLWILTTIAYYRSWSKRVDKPVRDEGGHHVHKAGI